MPRDVALIQIISQHRNHAHGFNGVEIGNDLARAFQRILRLELIGHRRAIDQGVIEKILMRVTIQCADVIGGG